MNILVAGGGVSGLSSALVLARAGHHVDIVEQDPLDSDASWEAAFTWNRKGAPQFHQSHAFIPRGRKVLRETLPDVYDTLMEAGATNLEVWRKAPHAYGKPPDEDRDLVYLCVRRELIEWALRKAAYAEPGIVMRPRAAVKGLLGNDGAVPRVCGVRTSTGEQIRADLVVDALGRRSPVPSWLSEMGGKPPEVQLSECAVIRYTRYFQMRPGKRFPEGPWLPFPRGDLGYAGFATFIGDNGTFAIVLLVPTWDRELRELRHEEAYMAACQSFPLMQPLVDQDFSEPITPVLPMGSLQNSLRNYAPDGLPVAEGIIPVADAYCHTDPTFALGLSMSLIHPVELARAIAAHQGKPTEIAADYFAATFPEAAERYAVTRDAGNAGIQMWRGERLDITKRTGSYSLFMLFATGAVAMFDPDVFRKATRRAGFLDRTSVFDDDVELQERVAVLFDKMIATGPRPPAGPSRDALLALINSAL